MAAPRREMSDRPTICQSLRATRPVITAAVQLLPSLRPFPLHTMACIPLLNCCFWRFDGEACIDLARTGQTPWPTSHATKPPVAGRSAARITAKPGSARRLHAASSHGPSWALFAKAHVSPEVVPWPLPQSLQSLLWDASMPEVVDLAGEAAAWLGDWAHVLILLMLGTRSPRFPAKNNVKQF